MAPETRRVTLEEVMAQPEIKELIEQANAHLGAMGFTEHGQRHVRLVSRISYNILKRLGFPEREAELAAIAGYLHDIGNVVSRHDHPESGAAMVFVFLREMGMPAQELGKILGAIGNHEEPYGEVVNNIGAAVILADKSDVHRTRVRNTDPTTFDIHDRVNYAVLKSFLDVRPEDKVVNLELQIDTAISPVMEYFEIFLSRMVMCRRAASFLGCQFELTINNARLL